MTYNAFALKTRIEELQRELDRCKAALEKADLPDEPIFEFSEFSTGPKYVTFVKRFGKSKAYTYAAVAAVSNKWFITGRQPADPVTGMTWDALMTFMVSEEYEYTRRQVIESYRELS